MYIYLIVYGINHESWRLTYITKTCKAHEAAVCPSQKHASICFC